MKENTQIVTGITGFVGVNLSKYLKEKNKKIIGVSRKPSLEEIDYHQLNKTVLDNSKSFIHLAGKAHDLKKTSEDSEYYQVNTELTKKLFNQFLESDCEVFIYVSSVKAVADKVDGVLTEESTPNPITVYGKSKLAAENYILSKQIPLNKRVYILRPCMVHGPNNKGNLNLLYTFVSKGVPYPFGKFKNKRSFVSVDNLCFIIDELIENNNIQSGIYNIADDESLSTNQLVSIIGKVVNKQAKILKTPKSIITLIAKLGDVLPLPINSERVQKLTENYVVSNTKIKAAMQKNLPLSAEKGLEKTIASF
ncbi:NAD-dependent epimerase/dehydratase family protein [Polaribacter sargassicola]|uniref:NAD-dependent epimerase/dehydratase family protein n=1 Tax=Polaribacter sargassicola TaxID=2836891 RepID=UPI001F01DFB3|nr:NAD-dependent epimerase/dehydratase family protein [Polaribacter sp. DS7-9]MCG1036551.1 NAD-dependent epimerase/dehydratase family protein [Polaribacter sp. DS7-9]